MKEQAYCNQENTFQTRSMSIFTQLIGTQKISGLRTPVRKPRATPIFTCKSENHRWHIYERTFVNEQPHNLIVHTVNRRWNIYERTFVNEQPSYSYVYTHETVVSLLTNARSQMNNHPIKACTHVKSQMTYLRTSVRKWTSILNIRVHTSKRGFHIYERTFENKQPSN